MTKKDYELFAHKINSLPKHTKLNFDELVLIIGNVFKSDNPSFSYEKFEEACYEGKHIRASIKE